MPRSMTTRVFAAITGADGGRTDRREARNGAWHVLALTASKLADGLINPKLVLSWLLSALGAPAALVGLLVPVREAGSLLPQVFLAPWVQTLGQRRWVWVAGSAGQGAAAALIALAALMLEGRAAGLAILGLLALLAVCRAACSVSYKDILGRTIGQTRRGAITGLAGSAAAVGVFIFALLMATGLLRAQGAVVAAIGTAALLWALAALALAQLHEDDGDDTPAGDGQGYLRILREDANLRWFVLVRGLLVSTALAPPYLVLLGVGEGGDALRQLGALVLASSASSFVSSYVWGRLADRSSRLVLTIAGGAGAAAMAAAILASVTGMAGSPWVIPTILFVLMLAYQGVRQARSVYLVDISPEDRRSLNAAVANTAIGVILLAAGALGGALTVIGPLATLTGFAVMALLGGLLAMRLKRP